MFSQVKFPRFSGTDVPSDFVEFPSQVYEMWAIWPEVLKNYAKHHETGAAMPAELIEKVLAAEQFNQGFATTEYLAAALLDQRWHQLAPEQVPDAADVLRFELEALKEAGVFLETVPPRYRSTYFAHAFSGATRLPITPTSGAKCSTLIVSNGSRRTAASLARTVTISGGPFFPAAALRKRSHSSAIPRRRSKDRAAPQTSGLTAAPSAVH
jgi:hypothetical protein